MRELIRRLQNLSFTILAALIVAALIAVVAYVGISFAIYNWVEDWVTTRLGLDYYPAQLLSTVVVVSATAVTPGTAAYLIFGRRRFYGASVLIGIQALVCAGIYTLGGSVCFDRKTGHPLCYYADTPHGRIWSRTPGFDPESGRAFRVYTREQREAEERSPPRR